MIAGNGKEYFKVPTTGGSCAGCDLGRDSKLCNEMSVEDCKAGVWREMTGKFDVEVADNEIKSFPLNLRPRLACWGWRPW